MVGFNIGGIPDVVCEDETGFLAPGGNVPGLSVAFMKALADRDHLRACGERGRALMQRDYSLEVQAKAYGAFYAETLADAARFGSS